MTFTARGVASGLLEQELRSLVQKISKAPLKTQQQLVLLKYYTVPRLPHGLALSPVVLKLLKKLDSMIRFADSTWLRLPHDCPLGFFHAPVEGSRLGITCLQTSVPALRVRRFQSVSESENKSSKAAPQLPYMTDPLESSKSESPKAIKKDYTETSFTPQLKECPPLGQRMCQAQTTGSLREQYFSEAERSSNWSVYAPTLRPA